MSVSVKIGDRTFEVATPYKLRQMEEAAPVIDAINDRAAKEATAAKDAEAAGVELPQKSMVENMTVFREVLGALLPGIKKADPSVTIETLVDEFDPSQWGELRSAFDAIFNSKGMLEGEAQAPVAAGPAEA